MIILGKRAIRSFHRQFQRPILSKHCGPPSEEDSRQRMEDWLASLVQTVVLSTSLIFTDEQFAVCVEQCETLVCMTSLHRSFSSARIRSSAEIHVTDKAKNVSKSQFTALRGPAAETWMPTIWVCHWGSTWMTRMSGPSPHLGPCSVWELRPCCLEPAVEILLGLVPPPSLPLPVLLSSPVAPESLPPLLTFLSASLVWNYS